MSQSLTSLQTSNQPAIKLASANMALLMRFSTSPEVMAQATQAATQMFQQAGATTMKMMQSDAFAQLMQGMAQNYAEFLGDSGRGAMAWMSQSQAALARGAEEAAGSVVEAAAFRAQRARKAG